MIHGIQKLIATLLTTILVLAGLTRDASGQSAILGWGGQVFDSRWNDEAFVEVAAGSNHTVARRSDGSAAAWGDNSYGVCNVPALPSGLAYVEFAAGTYHTVARLSDGSAMARQSASRATNAGHRSRRPMVGPRSRLPRAEQHDADQRPALHDVQLTARTVPGTVQALRKRGFRVTIGLPGPRLVGAPLEPLPKS